MELVEELGPRRRLAPVGGLICLVFTSGHGLRLHLIDSQLS